MSLLEDLQKSLGSSYAIERELGGGGMSRVFVGEELALGRKVVVKVLAPELAAGVSAERFQREIKLAAQLQHPNIVPVLTTGIAAGLPYYTMPFVDGLSLRQRLDRNAGVPIVEGLAILKDVARALAYAHDHGIVHRDIKPENVLLADEAAVVTDFGIAKALHAARTDAPGGTLTQAGASLGTPAYMAPEQISADPSVDSRADIYSFGCVAYELLTGAAPFSHRQPSQLYAAHISERPASLKDRRPDCPDDVAALIMKCLEKDPVNRPQSARELLRSLEGSQARTGSQPAPKPISRGKVAVISAIAGVALFSAIAAYATRDKGSAEIHSLAVLPFENIGGDTTNTYFAEGMSDELTTELARVPGLAIASRNAAARYRGKDAKEVGQALDVKGVIDGTVRRAGNRLRLTAQLTEAASGKILWADSYEQEVQDVFAVQDSIAKAIVSALQLKLKGDNAASPDVVNNQGTKDLAAYDLYLRGRYLFGKRGNSLYPAIRLFEEATKKDPKFARAYASYAMAASLLPAYTATPADSIVPLGLAAGRKALELDPGLADAHLGVANLLMFEFAWNEAETHYRRALEIEPMNATAHQWLGDLYYTIGRAGRAVPEVKRAVELDPTSPIAHTDYSYTLLITGDFEEARNEIRKAMEMDSSLVFNELNLANLFYDFGMYDSVHVADHNRSPFYTAFFRLAAYRKTGNIARARAMQDSLARLLSAPHVDDDGARRSVFYTVIGMPDSAFYWLDRVIDTKSGILFTGGIPCYSLYQPLYSDPRWDRVLARIKAVRCQKR